MTSRMTTRHAHICEMSAVSNQHRRVGLRQVWQLPSDAFASVLLQQEQRFPNHLSGLSLMNMTKHL